MESVEENNPTDMSVLLQFAKFSKGFQISDFNEFIQESVGAENLDFFGRLAYPNQWQMRLTNPDRRERLIRTGRTRIKNRSCWMYPLNQREIRGFVHWLPNSITNNQLGEYLQLYGDVLLVENKEREINGRKVESDSRYFGLIMSYGTVKEDLPHFLKINGFLCLVVVRGRQSACFHCKEVGHRRAECPKSKAKLNSFCNREPNTAEPRLRSRGRRHVRAETEVKDKITGNEVSSSDDIVCLERVVPVNKEITETHLLSISEECTRINEVQGEATDSTENEFAENVLADRKVKSKFENSATSLSETESRTHAILKTIQQIQQKTREDLQRRFENFEKKIALTITKGALSTHTRDQKRRTAIEDASINLEQEISSNKLEKQTAESYDLEETSTPDETPGDYSNVNTGTKETKDAEIRSDLPAMNHVKVVSAETGEKIYKKPQEMEKVVQSTESTIESSTINSDTMPALLIMKNTKNAAMECVKNTFKKLEEIVEGTKATERPTIDAAFDKDKLTSEKIQPILTMLETTKKIATDYSGNTFKNLEETNADLYQMIVEELDPDSKLTVDDISFASQMLEQAKEKVRITLQNTFRELEEKVLKIAEPSPTTELLPTTLSTTGANDSIPLPKIIETKKEPLTTFKLPRQYVDTAKHFLKEMEVVEIGDGESPENIQTQSDLVTRVQSDIKAAEICEPNEENNNITMTEKTLSDQKGMESNVLQTAQVDIDLQTSLNTIFASVQNKSELLPETREILKQVESEIIEVVEEN